MAAGKKLNCRDLLQYLQDLPAALITKLYDYSASCLAVLREVPELSQQYIMRMLFLEQPVPISLINSWPNSSPENHALHQTAMAKLENLRVCEIVPISGGQRGITLNSSFKKNLQTLLCGGGTPWAVTGHTGEDRHARDIGYLNTYADKQWESILLYMVGEFVDNVSSDTIDVLHQADLMTRVSSHSTITAQGFQFLLLDRPSQVWYFLLQYLSSAEDRDLDLVECLNFIFQLGFSTLGKDYSTEGLTPSQLHFIQHLRQFGLTYQRKRSSKRYFPTKLAINLVSALVVWPHELEILLVALLCGHTSLANIASWGHCIGESLRSCLLQGQGRSDDTTDTRDSKSGFIVLETNFRLMAYTDSQLQISILDLFSQLQYRFPNLAVGTITRESVHKALKNGITSEQILGFLRIHAHPRMLNSVPVIPSTVSDQIRLWELERDRLEISEGVLYSDFLSVSDFEVVRKYAEDLGALIWSYPMKRYIVVASSGHDEVKRFWRRHSKK